MSIQLLSVYDSVFRKIYKLACAPIKDSDQHALLHGLIVFNGSSIGRQGSNISSGEKLRL